MALEKNPLKKKLILGSQGQLGKALLQILGDSTALAASRKEADLSQPKQLLSFLDQVHTQIDAVINASAYTQVDLAEKEGELAWKVNAHGPGILAQWCAARSIPFVHFSTDYVFSGEGTRPWTEQDPIAPLNTYGKTKAEGEKQIIQAGGKYLIFRTSWVYDHQGKNFLNTMLRLGKEKEHLRIINDQFGAPTYAPDLAKASWEALQKANSETHFPSGIYHLCSMGETTWFEFAKTIFEGARSLGVSLKVQNIDPIASHEYPTAAKRPLNSRLSLQKFIETFGIQPPNWKDSLKVCLEEII